MKDNSKMKGNKQFSAKSAAYTQETSKEFGASIPTDNISPQKLAKKSYNQQGAEKNNADTENLNQEASRELDFNKVLNAGKDNTGQSKRQP